MQASNLEVSHFVTLKYFLPFHCSCQSLSWLHAIFDILFSNSGCNDCFFPCSIFSLFICNECSSNGECKFIVLVELIASFLFSIFTVPFLIIVTLLFLLAYHFSIASLICSFTSSFTSAMLLQACRFVSIHQYDHR